MREPQNFPFDWKEFHAFRKQEIDKERGYKVILNYSGNINDGRVVVLGAGGVSAMGY